MQDVRPVRASRSFNRRDRTLLDLLAAIQLVAAGSALRLVLSGLPDVDQVAADALALAQAVGVAFVIVHRPGEPSPTVLVGPRRG